MPDEFQYKKPVPAVVDNGSGMFQPPGFDAYLEDGTVLKSTPPVIGPTDFDDPLLGFMPPSMDKIPDIPGESQRYGLFLPLGFDDPLLG